MSDINDVTGVTDGGVDSSASVPRDRKSGEHGHVPVLLDRVTDLLAPGIASAGSEDGSGAVVVDGTLGAGGHAEHLLEVFPGLHLIGLDRDRAALDAARRRLERFGDRFVGVQTRFDGLADVIAIDGGVAVPGFDPDDPDAVDPSAAPIALAREAGLAGSLFDLGVSSMQLDQVDRGFAYRVDAPLDMRMDPTTGPTAADVLNGYSHGDLARILSTYGDERFAGRIATAVLRERDKEPFSTSGRLVELLYDAIPAASRRTGGHPAKRTFQALRVEVNRELEALENVLPMACEGLAVGGRTVCMSYQSLEDRLVKREFAERVKSTTPAGLPMELPGHEPKFRLVTRGAVKADEAEIAENPRAAPVRVRCIERIRPD
ncbi:16S rRNA (cytosine(1402)-N(4))-methyltransferase RsmH [uncultured Corynebacterium sp.]|uniref:16S rRNA (cytosine(1402)-N(4))-methyltransferase RsmH n=1 Tax=uncultured Corynebacterium sp. TaxID=159447 RepID=UPI0025F69980|nr:16S rRNA (cytosine(1402)-N(4))-methyltransferase RsmH [uncultured Corynebacterium sp.]